MTPPPDGGDYSPNYTPSWPNYTIPAATSAIPATTTHNPLYAADHLYRPPGLEDSPLSSPGSADNIPTFTEISYGYPANGTMTMSTKSHSPLCHNVFTNMVIPNGYETLYPRPAIIDNKDAGMDFGLSCCPRFSPHSIIHLEDIDGSVCFLVWKW